MSDKDVCPYFEYISFRLFQADKQTNCTYNSKKSGPYIINYNSQPIAEAPRTAAAASVKRTYQELWFVLEDFQSMLLIRTHDRFHQQVTSLS